MLVAFNRFKVECVMECGSRAALPTEIADELTRFLPTRFLPIVFGNYLGRFRVAINLLNATSI